MSVVPSSLRVLTFPDPVLRRKAMPVERVDDWVREVAKRMIELMHEAEGIGLAAPQVGIPLRLFVVDVDEADVDQAVYLNPRLHDFEGDLEAKDEGCLSLPGIRAEIRRPPQVRITATGLDERPFTRAGSGLLARVWQHEFDHLEGTLILDRMTPIDRIATRRAVKDLMSSSER